VANEFADQLGLSIASRSPLALEPMGTGSNPVSSLTIDRWVDAEVLGNVGVLIAFDQARQILEAIAERAVRQFVVIVPRFGQPWGRQNIRFLEFFNWGLQRIGGRLILMGPPDDTVPIPDGWDLRWIEENGVGPDLGTQAIDPEWRDLPGLIPAGISRSTRSNAVTAWTLTGGLALLPPRLRRDPATLRWSRWSSLLPTPRAGDAVWLGAYRSMLIPDRRQDIAPLSDYAMLCFNTGDVDLSLKLARAGVERAAIPIPQGYLQFLFQLMNLVVYRYEDVASEETSPGAIPDVVRDRWLRVRAYAAALVGRADLARACLAATVAFGSSDPASWDDLYARNLMALIEFRQGDWEAARRLQASIESTLEREPTEHSQIRYLNALNTARLYRQRRQFAPADDYYRKAFRLTDGLRVEGDRIYMNFCLARQAEDQGRPREAFLHWLRASLHWVAMSVPEALNWRCASGILGRRVDPESAVVDELSGRLLNLLLGAARTAGVGHPEEPRSVPAPVFLSTETAGLGDDDGPVTCLGGEGCYVYARSTPVPAPYESGAHRDLRGALWGIIRSLAEVANEITAATVQVDSRFGHEIPATESEAIDVAVRFRAARFLHRGEEIALAEPFHTDWERRSTIRLGGGVASVKRMKGGPLLTFHRLRDSVRLRPDDEPLLDAALSRARIADLPGKTISRLRTLEQQHVIQISN